MEYTDSKIDFEKITDDMIEKGQVSLNEIDVLDFLINFIESKGQELQKQHYENKQRMLEVIQKMKDDEKRRKENGDSEDYGEDESPGEEDAAAE